MSQKPNRLDPHAEALTRMLLKPEFGGDGKTYAQAAAWLAERGVKRPGGKPLLPAAINQWWVPRRANLEKKRDLAGYVRGARQEAEALANAPGYDPLLFMRAANVQLGALVVRLMKSGNLDPETTEQVKGLFAELKGGVREERGEKEFAFDREKFAKSLLSKIELGIEAIHAEIKGDAEAEALVARLKERVLKAAHEA